MATTPPVRKTILVVEDDPSLLELFSVKLKKEGYSVLSATDGASGLAVALDKHPHLIVLDMLLPQMKGTEVLQELRKDPWGSKVPVIVLSNLDDSQHIFDTLSNGALDYLVKADVSLDQIVDQIRFRLKS
jgi:two-component system, sensor histidine kinase and response regulator